MRLFPRVAPRPFSASQIARALAAVGSLDASWRPHAGTVTDETGARIDVVTKRPASDAWAHVAMPLTVPVNVPRANVRDRLRVVQKLMPPKRRTA